MVTIRVDLPDDMVSALDDMAEEAETDRSEIVLVALTPFFFGVPIHHRYPSYGYGGSEED